jgi:tRNA pseudouridine55 synthase
MKKEGILLVDKEKGKTAFYLVKLLRKKSDIKKIGHAGILDPFATGVMVMLIGRSYTKMASKFLQDDKEYEATIKLGVATNTFDCEGFPTFSSPSVPSLEEIEVVIEKFQGETTQIPPMFSAKKVQGQKLYHLARKGIEIARAPIPIKLKTDLIDYSYPLLRVKITCSKGTYMRTIAHDIGEKLGCGAHLTELVRTRSGSFHIKDCIDAKILSIPSFDYVPFLKKIV